MEIKKNTSIIIPKKVKSSNIRVGQLIYIDEKNNGEGIPAYRDNKSTLFVGCLLPKGLFLKKNGTVIKTVCPERKYEEGIYVEVKDKKFFDFGDLPEKIDSDDLTLLIYKLEEYFYKEFDKIERRWSDSGEIYNIGSRRVNDSIKGLRLIK